MLPDLSVVLEAEELQYYTPTRYTMDTIVNDLWAQVERNVQRRPLSASWAMKEFMKLAEARGLPVNKKRSNTFDRNGYEYRVAEVGLVRVLMSPSTTVTLYKKAPGCNQKIQRLSGINLEIPHDVDFDFYCCAYIIDGSRFLPIIPKSKLPRNKTIVIRSRFSYINTFHNNIDDIETETIERLRRQQEYFRKLAMAPVIKRMGKDYNSIT